MSKPVNKIPEYELNIIQFISRKCKFRLISIYGIDM